jgi:energy-coupling factor transporter transmembrane protein EcfT
MLQISFFYFAARYYYQLAESCRKQKYLYGILGIIIFYSGQVVGEVAVETILYFVTFVFKQPQLTVYDSLWSMLSFPFGILICWMVYRLLKKKWQYEENPQTESMIED